MIGGGDRSGNGANEASMHVSFSNFVFTFIFALQAIEIPASAQGLAERAQGR